MRIKCTQIIWKSVLVMAYIGEGRRKGKILTYRGFIYQKNKATPNLIHWRCADKNCRVPLKTALFDINDPPANVDVLDYVGDASHHGHGPDIEAVEKIKVVNAMKERVKSNPSAPVKRTFDETISILSQTNDPPNPEDIPLFDEVAQVLRRKKRENVPPIPQTVADVHIQGVWAETWDGQNNLAHCDNAWGIAIFATLQQIRLLRRAKIVFADGTFRSTPLPYKQTYTIHALIRRHVIKIATCTMINKNTGSYRQVLRALKIGVRQHTGHRWRPETVVVDFELAAVNAFESEFPNSRVRGCYFHFNQALWRHIGELGLVRPYKDNRRFKKLVKKVMAIGFLPLAFVQNQFNMLRNTNSTRRMVARYPRLDDFLSYVSNTYINGQFPPAMWNVYDRPMETRTTNAIESYHRRWNQAVGVRHPSLWAWIRVLKDQYAINQAEMRKVRDGRPAPRRRLKWRRLENRVSDLKNQFTAGGLTLGQYWDAVKYLIMDH